MTKVTHTLFGLRAVIPEMERAVVLKDGIFEAILGPGRHKIGRLGNQARFVVRPFALSTDPIHSELLTSVLRNHKAAAACRGG